MLPLRQRPSPGPRSSPRPAELDTHARRSLGASGSRMRGTLNGLRILDLTGEIGFLAGMLLGELGADVVKVEPPAGDPARRRPPFWGGVEDPERAILWLAQNGSKRGITLDLQRPAGRDVFLRLVARTDVVLETGALSGHGLGWDALHASNPRTILCSLTPFGQTGPRA